ncbi:hypothetical protein TCAL_02907 [Tigriopus californicus]|uniref:Photolyase/cryptochrome alpha/beta domain-containing protein n=1 Tax=Tigriopus californicus TaxID=6832 RepID=A0A553NQG3_TIGCA|nr:cryptochrome-2-like isoform X1 [Tigriopus californicus]TRY67619.1 hypothetical protein TCAL_02907 [Tigriopus californicus]|eukprot:TCALIF_02907-PA protein Name:"Similar to Cry2 Cryptochrome-2 (Mus musculus)" AED:0.12 eAED:0.12 QI:146/1/1/1/0.66/0.75/4/181/529
MTQSTGSSAIHWFRKGLRLHDNPALLSALAQPGELRPLFILDPHFVAHAHVGVNRWRFLQQSLQDLDDQLRARGSRLFVARGQPETILPELFKQWRVQWLTFEVDTEPYALKRDAQIEALAQEAGVVVDSRISHTLYSVHRVIQANHGKAPLTYVSFQKVVAKLGDPPTAVACPPTFPTQSQLSSPADLSDVRYNVPELEELGVKAAELRTCRFPGGETEGRRRLQEYLSDKRAGWVRAFEKPQTPPNSLEPSTTVLSPYLKFGCVSSREMYWRLQDILKKGKHSQPPVSLVGQLLWREFYYVVAADTPHFDRMKGNPLCKQIPWDDNPEYLKAWSEARTGYPWIDAVMIQLRDEGWIHHLARHAVACFLTRGDLYLSWEDGQRVFEELLLDADWALNAGNWMWLSASAFFHQYFRVYSPVAFGKKTDPTGEYIRKYVPKLKKYPKEYIYEPWKAPLSVQKAAGCIIGTDYPKPIVNHDTIHKVNIGRHKAAYSQGKDSNQASGTTKPAKRPETGSKGQTSMTKFMKKK